MKRYTPSLTIVILLVLSTLALGGVIHDEQTHLVYEEEYSNQTSADYLIVLANSTWEDAIQPFVEFKGSQGRIVRTITVEGYPYIPSDDWELSIEEGNVNFNHIHGEIVNVWQEEGQPWPFYTLLVGAAEYLSPAFNGYVDDLIYDVTWRMWRDHEYWDLDGNANTYQTMVGRWPVYNETEIQWLTDRTIAYTNTWGEWTEDIRVWGTFESDINDVADQLSAGLPYNVSTLIGGSAVYDEVTQQFFEDGHSLYFYRGHGGPYIWQGGDYTTKDYYERGLEYPENYPDARQGLMLSIACSTGKLYNITRHTSYGDPWGIIGDGSYRNIGEQWVLNRNGGVGFLGACRFMTSGANTELAQALVDGLVDGVTKLGELALISKDVTIQYNLLGDPDTDLVFRAEAPIDVTVTRPDGGEAWGIGTEEAITWTTEEGAYPIDSVDLLYSTDTGISWTTIETELPDTGSYMWTIPDEVSLECLVKAVVRDTQGNTREDTSDGYFAIIADPIEVTVISPNGGEIWTARTTETISWLTDEGDNTVIDVDLEYSSNAGITWNIIDTGLPDTGSYSWELSNVASDECLVRVTVYDDLGLSYSDESDGYFEIVGIPPAPPSNLMVEHHGSSGTQELFEEDFTGVDTGTIPEGWTKAPDTTHWRVEDTNRAGGLAPELEFYYSPSETSIRRCYTPAIDSTSFTELELNFRHFLDDYGSQSRYTLRVETSSDGSNWEEIWSIVSPIGDIGPEVVTIPFSHNVGSDTLYISWTFDGNSYDMWRWDIDDIILTGEGGEGDEHNLLTWDASPDDPDEVSQYNIYRSEELGGQYTLVNSVDSDGSAQYSYLDENKGTADEILWWYIVRVVGINGMEEQNTDAVQEPGGETVTFDIPLHAGGDADGWNFVSFNLIPLDTSLEAILDDIAGSYDRVMFYDAVSGEWLSYVPGRAARYNNLHSWNHRMGLWIHMTATDTLTVEGYVPASTDITLYPGWTMIGLPSSTSGNHGLPTEVDVIGYFVASAEYNLAYDYSPGAFVFEPGQGYWLYNGDEEAVVWTVDY